MFPGHSNVLPFEQNSNVAEAVWADAMSAILPPTKMVVSGEWPEDDTQAIVIANHQVDNTYKSLTKNQNASRPFEHPPVRGENVKPFRWNHRLQIRNLFVAFKRVP